MTEPIYPCLWFDGNAKTAAEFYCSVFPNSVLTTDTPSVVNFEVRGQKFMCLNGGSQFKINPSISFFVVCETDEETTMTWNKLIDGGEVLMPLNKYDWSEKYGWCQDRFGVSWQVAFGNLSDVGQKFTPSLLFSGEQYGKAEEAVHFYTSIFPNSSITGILKNSEDGEKAGTIVRHAHFVLNNYVMMAMDSEEQHSFNFNEGVSLVVSCTTQQKIDHFWSRLGEGGQEGMCGWIRDKFGVWWQIIPGNLSLLMSDPERAPRVAAAFMKMRKLDIAALQGA